jgi:hypothetical protein
LDWEYTTEDVVSVQDYESQKYGIEEDGIILTVPTKMNDLRISPEERIALLLHSSQWSELEIRRATRQFHRNKNCSLRQCERIHETFFHCRHPNSSEEDSSEEEEDDDNDAVVVDDHQHPKVVAVVMSTDDMNGDGDFISV